jgi:hypothetical protein
LEFKDQKKWENRGKRIFRTRIRLKKKKKNLLALNYKIGKKIDLLEF